MAAPTVTFDQPKAAMLGASHFAFITGIITISSYDNTHPSAGIEKNFLSLASTRVVIDAISTLGFHVRWNSADGSVRCFQSLTAAADTEVTNATNVGVVNFHAFGQMG